MTVAILVLTHNSASYIRRTLYALQKALGSNASVHSVRIYDDASTDDTCCVARQAWTCTVPLIVSRTDHNQGECCNANRGFSDLRNEGVQWVILLHADDEVIPGWIERATEIATASPSTLGMVCCNTRYVHGQTPTTAQPTESTDADPAVAPRCGVTMYEGSVDSIKRLKQEWFWNVSGSLIRTENYCRVGGFLPRLTYAGDNDFLVRFLESGSAVAYVPTPFIVKYHHSRCMTSRLIRSGEYAIGWAHLMLRHARFATKMERTREFGLNVAVALRRAITAFIRGELSTVRGQCVAVRILIQSWLALLLGANALIPHAVTLLLETPHDPL